MLQRTPLAALLLLAAAPLVSGCGYSEDEWQAQLAKYGQLQSESAKKEADLQKELQAARDRVAQLEKELSDQGVQLNKVSGELEDRDKALAEYKARAKQLEAIKARFDLLRQKLQTLVNLGLEVNIRRNRMIISLPGDVLFDSGKDKLRKEGEDILKKVAEAIKSDKALINRDYQVAGHTDSSPLNSPPFNDNWGLSLARSRSVLLHLIGKEGGLPRQHWSAAGFADTDPLGPNTTPQGKQKNRRCELIVVPDVDEMLDLTKIAGAVPGKS
ncbi:OmpA family protein [Chondromyces crocatus]|uniref:Membrane protein n=1 Tax=Chondromyces crocatus TaxID=52 RepID=A0A0K1ELJ8_CHOCO|nr:OmpA family protein [Chondromyces crocatus]AKT41676.1 membrane protein [Chondromyces crocatus]